MKQRTRRSRRPFYMIVILTCLLLLIGGGYLVYAAMTARDRKENDFRIGQVETKLFEENFDEDMTGVKRNESVPKEVRIENNGTIKQFVRVMVLPEVRKSVVGDDQNIQLLPLSIGAGADMELERMDAKWVNGGDGYYYYTDSLAPKARTDYLFRSVKLSNQLEDRYNQASFKISLKVETINCAEFAYRDAWWQGITPTDGPLQTIDTELSDKTE